MPSKPCEWTTQKQALSAFAGFTEKTQSAGHIKPLHWYVACRLVLEGGFDPETIKPRPPFTIRKSKRYGLPFLQYDESVATGQEATVLGGLKTKNVDVVVSLPGVGPVVAVSCKGTTGAFRNLTNRMEELVGDCTNLHISYPSLVLGYLHLLRANRQIGEVVEMIEGEEDLGEDEDQSDEVKVRAKSAKPLTKNDMAFTDDGIPTAEIGRFAVAISRLAGRKGIRDDQTRYESIGLALVEATGLNVGDTVADFPKHQSSLDIENFFERLYSQYDERFVYGAPSLNSVTRRWAWSPESDALSRVADYEFRKGVPKMPKGKGQDATE